MLKEIPQIFEPIKLLGESNITKVWLVKDLFNKDKTVVFKSYKGYIKKEIPLEEFSLLTRINHPNIIKVFDLGHWKDTLYFTSEYIAGLTLDKIALSLNAQEIIESFIQCSSAILYLHQKGIIHGDLKPSNIIINKERQTITTKIIDFGMTTLLGNATKGTTIFYMHPEFLIDNKSKTHFDIFSLALSYYVSLLPEDLRNSLKPHQLGQYPELKIVRKDLPENFTILLDSIVHLNPEFKVIDILTLLTQFSGIKEYNNNSLKGISFIDSDIKIIRQNEIDKLACFINNYNVILTFFPPGFNEDSTLTYLKWHLQSSEKMVWEISLDNNYELGEKLLKESNNETFIITCDQLQNIKSLLKAIQKSNSKIIISTSSEEIKKEFLNNYKEFFVYSMPPLNIEEISSIISNVSQSSSIAKEIFHITNGIPHLVYKEIDRLFQTSSINNYVKDENTLLKIEGIFEKETDEIEKNVLKTVHLIHHPASFEMVSKLLSINKNELSSIIESLLIKGYLSKIIDPTDNDTINYCVSPLWIGVIEKSPIQKAKELHKKIVLFEKNSYWNLYHSCFTDNKPSKEKIHSEIINLRESFKMNEAILLLDCFLPLNPDSDMFGELLIEKGLIKVIQGQTDEGIQILKEIAFNKSLNNPDTKAQALIALGEINERIGNLSESIDYLKKALDITQHQDLKHKILDRLSKILLKTGDYKQAINYSDELLTNTNLPVNFLISANYTKGVAHYYFGEYEKAEQFVKNGLYLAQKEDFKRDIIRGFNHKGMIEMADEQWEEARKSYEKSVELAQSAGDKEGIPLYYLNLGTVYMQIGLWNQAYNIWQKSRESALSVNNNDAYIFASLNLVTLMSNFGGLRDANFLIKEIELLGSDKICTANSNDSNVEIDVQSQFKNPLFEAQHNLCKGEILFFEEKYKEAIHFFEKAYLKFTKLNVESKAQEANLFMAQSFIKIGENGKAKEILKHKPKCSALFSKYHLLLGLIDFETDEQGNPSAVDNLTKSLQLASLYDQLSKAEIYYYLYLFWEKKAAPLAERYLIDGYELLFKASLNVPSSFKINFWQIFPRNIIKEIGEKQEKKSSETVLAKNLITEEKSFKCLKLGSKVLEEQDIGRILNSGLDIAIEVSGAERGFIILKEDNSKTDTGLKITAARSIDRESLKKPSSKYSRSIAEQVINTGESILTVSAEEDGRFWDSLSVHSMGLKSVMCVPIRTTEKTLGVIYLDNRFQKGKFTQYDLDLMLYFANIVGLAIHNAMLLGENQKRAQELEVIKLELEKKYITTQEELLHLKEDLKDLKVVSPVERNFKYNYSNIIGKSKAVMDIFSVLDRVIDKDVPVLIEGESGTGKDLIARAIHYNSPRKDQPYVSVNCGALSEGILDSELFGHEKGAFTGAIETRKGLIREADGGTLFLDEISEMSPEMQVKLLRVIQNREVRPLGSEKVYQIDVRFIAASNKQFEMLLKNGKFREDLYFRLNVVKIYIPPLRERKEDILELVSFILAKCTNELKCGLKKLSPQTVKLILSHNFPGNVRELENLLTAACAMSEGEEIQPIHLPFHNIESSNKYSSANSKETLLKIKGGKEISLTKIKTLFIRFKGNKIKIANELNVSRPTLYKILKDYKLDDNDDE